MRKILSPFLLLLIMVVTAGMIAGCQDTPEETAKKEPAPAQSAATPAKPKQDGCSPGYRELVDYARVSFEGQGTMDITIVSDPLCWHCRLGHKLLAEYPELYGKVRLFFSPRKSYIGSDMAAWILEEYAQSENLKKMIDYAYSDLKQPKTKDLVEARMLVLAQFTEAFPDMLQGTTLADLYEQLQLHQEFRTYKGKQMGEALKLPGTPILIAGRSLVLGYGPEQWIEALKKNDICE